MRPLTFTADINSAGCTVQHVLTEVFMMSHSHIARLKRREGGILRNGEKCYVTARLSEGDTLTALISDPPETHRLEGWEHPLPIAVHSARPGSYILSLIFRRQALYQVVHLPHPS